MSTCGTRILLVLMLVLTLTADSQPLQQRHRWAGFRIGSWVLLKTVAADGTGHPTYVKFTLREITRKAAIVRMEVQGGGMTQDISFPIPENKHSFDRERPDNISFAGKQLHCRAFDVDERHVTVWECPEVPGFVAKQKSPSTQTFLVAFHANK